jgi:hypothetical protein
MQAVINVVTQGESVILFLWLVLPERYPAQPPSSLHYAGFGLRKDQQALLLRCMRLSDPSTHAALSQFFRGCVSSFDQALAAEQAPKPAGGAVPNGQPPHPALAALQA